MKVMLGSGGFRTESRIQSLSRHMRQHFGSVERLLFIPYALADYDRYLQVLTERGLNGGYSLDGIQTHTDPLRAVREAQAIYVGGGNSFRLLHTLQHLDLIPEIRSRVQAGLPYLGISAGANLACPTIMTTNDMPIVQPATFNALGLVPFQINPHYFNGKTFVKRDEEMQEHFGETRDDRIREFHEMNDTPVLGLWEGGILRIEKGTMRLEEGAARLFRQGQETEDYEAGADLSFLL